MPGASRLIRIPPPIVFIATFLVGMVLQYPAPSPALSPGFHHLLKVIGLTLLGAGIILALYCVSFFIRRRTTMIPHSTATALLTEGPYRFSRNPMYVSVVLMYTGIAIALVQLCAVVLLPVPILFLEIIVIPFEESRLRQVFGADYHAYCARVRRWL